MSQKKLDSREKRTIAFMIALISQVGISMMVPIFLCLFVGIKINKYTDKPLVVILAVMIGCIVAFRNVYMLLKQTYASDMKKENEELEYFKNLERTRLEKEKEKNK